MYLMTFSTGHSSGHVPAPAVDLHQARGQADSPQLQRVLQNIHREPPEKMQTGWLSFLTRTGSGSIFRALCLVRL